MSTYRLGFTYKQFGHIVLLDYHFWWLFWKKGPICAHSSLIQGGLKFIYIYRFTITCLTHLPSIIQSSHLGFIITCLTHLIFILDLCLYCAMVTRGYLHYLSSCIYPLVYSAQAFTSLTHNLAFPFILVFILPVIYSLISFALPAYSVYSTRLYIFQITYLLTLFNLSLYILCYSLTRFAQLTFMYIFSVTCTSLIFTFNITPSPFSSLLFFILYSPSH